jgi:hypothetical protein
MNQNLLSVREQLNSALADQPNGAIFSADRRHRYLLWRQWSTPQRLVLFIGLNPSTADETLDDPTIRRCREYAKSWSASGFMIANLFAFRATLPSEMRAFKSPIGEDNDAWIDAASATAYQTVACWGNHGDHLQRASQVLPKLVKPGYLKMTKANQPSHPLYLLKSLHPIAFNKVM